MTLVDPLSKFTAVYWHRPQAMGLWIDAKIGVPIVRTNDFHLRDTLVD